MKTRTNRLWAALLSCLLVLSLMPVGAMASWIPTLPLQSIQTSYTPSGTLTTVGDVVTWTVNKDAPISSVQLSGGLGSVAFEISNNLITWSAKQGTPIDSSTGASTASAAGTWKFGLAGYRYFRVRCVTISSTITVSAAQTASDGSGVGGGSSGGGGGAVTAGDGDLTTIGANADAAVGDGTGTLNAHARQIAKLLGAGISSTVTNGGTFAVQSTIAGGAFTDFGAKADAKNSASDTTSISAMSVWKQISFEVQKLFAVAAGATDSGNPVKVGGVYSSSLPTLTDGQRGNLQLDSSGRVLVNPTNLDATYDNVGLKALTTGGCTPWVSIDLDPTGQVVKASAGQVYSCQIFNHSSAVIYVKFYNKATAPDENDTPVKVLAIPPTDGGVAPTFQMGVAFGTGISVRCTTGRANNSTADTTAGDCVANIDYK